MRFRTLPLVALLLAALTLVAQEKPAPKYEMTTYYFCLLTKGPNSGTGTREEAAAIQAGHMANIRRLAEAGKLIVAGPFADGGEWRGIFIFKCASLEEAQALVATDPAVQAGRLKAEIHPWLTAKGNIHDPDIPGAPQPLTH